MPAHSFDLTLLLQVLENDDCVAEALFFPEFSRLGDDADILVEALLEQTGKQLKELDAAEFCQRRGPTEVVGGTVPVTLEPPPGQAGWREPVELSLLVVRWQQGDSFLAHVPALGIEVVAGSAEEREQVLPRHARIAILRLKANRLDRLAWLTRVVRLDVRRSKLTIERPTAKQAAIAEREDSDKQETVLVKVATRLDFISLAPAFEMEEALSLLAESLTGRQPRSVLLIGPSGVGKTALVHQLVRERKRFHLDVRPFWATSGAQLVSGQSGYGMWQERCQKLWREASRQQAIVHLGNLVELLEVGKSEHQSQGLATFLRPWLARGELLAILECTPEQMPMIERQDPHLLRVFTPIRLREPEGERLANILSQVASWKGARLLPGGLAEVLRLHRRYAAYSANPGRPLRFLQNLIIDQPAALPIDARTVTTAFAKETGLPLVLLEDSVRLDLDEARRWFAARVIGQTEAVDLVVDLLAGVKAALNRPRKPIASLLFIGPTGVGKTEMAKALAEYLFGSRDRLTRFDMSEFADPLSVQRLIGGVLTSEGVLTARVREQPFSVILLDEVEKAHPQLFDLLLQVLGEGRLTDAAGRLADFCNSVVIMTSNLGADSYLQGDFGLVAGQPTAQRAREHFVREVEKALRPEMVNRIDRIVPFAPLDPSVIQQIAKRQLDLLRHRDGIRYRGVTIEESADLIAWLAKKGYDARYGARPLKRAIEREVLAPLAAQMNTYTTDTALTVRLRLHENLPHVQVRARTDPTGQMVAVGGPQQEEVQVARNTVQLRRSLQKLNSCSALIEVHNEIFRMEKAQNRAHAYDPKLASLTRLRDDIHSATAEAVAQEDEVLMRLHGQAAGPGTGLLPLGKKVEEGLARFDQLVLSLYLRQFDEANRISLVVFSEDQATVFALAWAYYRLALAARCRASIWQITPPRIDRSAQRTEEVKKFEHLFELPERRLLLQADDVFTDKPTVSVRIWVPWRKTFQEEVANVSRTKGVIGLGLELQGEAVYPRYAPEEGLHHFQTPRHSSKALVVTDTNPMTELTFPEGIDRRGAIGSQPRRRLYRLEQGGAEDSRLGWQNLPNLALEAVVSHCLESTLKLAAAEVLQS